MILLAERNATLPELRSDFSKMSGRSGGISTAAKIGIGVGVVGGSGLLIWLLSRFVGGRGRALP